MDTPSKTLDQEVSEALQNMNNAMERIGKDISATQIIDVTTLLPIPPIDVVTPSHPQNSSQDVSNTQLPIPTGDVATPVLSSMSTMETNTVYETLLETPSSLSSSFVKNLSSENTRSPQLIKERRTNRERFELECKIKSWRLEQSKLFPSSLFLPPLPKTDNERKTRSAPSSPVRRSQEQTVPHFASLSSTDVDLPRPFFYLSSTVHNSTFKNEMESEPVPDATKKILEFLANKVDLLAVSINTLQFNLTKIAESVQLTRNGKTQETASNNLEKEDESGFNIVNLKNVEDIDEWIKSGKGRNVYIARGNGKCEASPWANYHRLRDHNNDREKVLELYRADIMANDELREKVPELKGKVLGCWCSPYLCHAQVLHELAGNTPNYEPEPPHTFDQKLDSLENKFDSYAKTLNKENKAMREENAQLKERLEKYIWEETEREERIKECFNNLVNVPTPYAIDFKEDIYRKLSDLDARINECERCPDNDSPASPQPRTRLRSFSDECRDIPQEIDDDHPYYDLEDMDTVKAKLDNLTTWMNELERQIADTDVRVLECEQYSRRECVIISGIPGNIQDNQLESTVLNILRNLQIYVHETDISAIHRLGVSTNPRYPARVIVKFVNRKITDKCFEKRDRLPDLYQSLKMNIRFFESLAQLNQESLKLCTWLKENGLIYDHFMRNGFSKIVIAEKDKPMKVPHPQFLRDKFDIPANVGKFRF